MVQSKTVEMTSFPKKLKPRHFQQIRKCFFIPHKSAVRMADEVS